MKTVQIAASAKSLYALRDNGDVIVFDEECQQWSRLPDAEHQLRHTLGKAHLDMASDDAKWAYSSNKQEELNKLYNKVVSIIHDHLLHEVMSPWRPK